MGIEKQTKGRISLNEWQKRIDVENKTLSEPYSGKSLSDLKKLRDILLVRLNMKNDDSNIVIIDIDKEKTGQLSDTEITERINDTFENFKKDEKIYQEDLKIIEGLIKSKELNKI